MPLLIRKILFVFLLSFAWSGYAQSQAFTVVSNATANAYQKRSLNTKTLAVIVNEVPLAHTRQFLPVDSKGVIVSVTNVTLQLKQLFYNIDVALQACKSNVNSIVKINFYLTEGQNTESVMRWLVKFFRNRKMPAVSFVSGNLSNSDALVAADVVATSGSNTTQVVYFPAQEAIASVAVLPAKGTVYVSGQAAKGDAAQATAATLQQLDATLNYLGITQKQVIQLKCFLNIAADADAVRSELSKFYKNRVMPPVVFVDWQSKDPLVEIELIAASSPINTVAPQVEYITPPGMTASPVYAKVTRLNYGKRVYLSSVYGDTSTNAGDEVNSMFNALGQVLSNSNSSFNHLVKATYYVNSDKTSQPLNEVRARFYQPTSPPAASKAMVKSLGINGKNVTMDMIGVVAK